MAIIIPELDDIWAPLTAPVAASILSLVRDPETQARIKADSLVASLLHGFASLPQLPEVLAICLAQDALAVAHNMDVIEPVLAGLPSGLRLQLVQLRLQHRMFIPQEMMSSLLEDHHFLQWLKEARLPLGEALLLLSSLPEPDEVSPEAREVITDALCAHADAFFAERAAGDRSRRLAVNLLNYVPTSRLMEASGNLAGLQLLTLPMAERAGLLEQWATNPEQLLQRMRLALAADKDAALASLKNAFPRLAEAIRRSPVRELTSPRYQQLAHLFCIGLDGGALQMGDLVHWVPPMEMLAFLAWAGNFSIEHRPGRLFADLLADCPPAIKDTLEQVLIDRVSSNRWDDAITPDLVNAFPRLAAAIVGQGADLRHLNDVLLIANSDAPVNEQAAACLREIILAQWRANGGSRLSDKIDNDNTLAQLKQLNARWDGLLDADALYNLLREESSRSEAPYVWGSAAQLWVTLCGLDRETYQQHRHAGKSLGESFLATRFPPWDTQPMYTLLIALGAPGAPEEVALPMINGVLQQGMPDNSQKPRRLDADHMP